ncbi:MAG TPA: DinB family protein [Blastocatellia bacterium]|nr:DinB family protein [Blastocatellia bacterium]
MQTQDAGPEKEATKKAMLTNDVGRYRRWFDYEVDAHAKVIASFEATPEDKRATPPYHKAVDPFAHMMLARRLWLYRFGRLAEGPREFFPQNVALDAVKAMAEETQAAWSAYFERLDETELARVFEYRALDGPRYRSRVEDILTQLFGHSWYHRGQIALLLRQAGGEPAATDFVFWSRELIGE